MPSEPSDNSAQPAAQGRSAERGRPFPKGTSGNPGGRPKWERHLRKALSAGSPDVAELLLGLIRGNIRNVIRTDDGDLIEVDPHMKERLKAAELWLAYMVAKPKEASSEDKKPERRPWTDEQVENALRKLDAH